MKRGAGKAKIAFTLHTLRVFVALVDFYGECRSADVLDKIYNFCIACAMLGFVFVI